MNRNDMLAVVYHKLKASGMDAELIFTSKGDVASVRLRFGVGPERVTFYLDERSAL